MSRLRFAVAGWLARRWPLLVPPLFFAVLFALQPPDRIVIPFADGLDDLHYPLGNGMFTRYVTDDSDALAYALRAENAARGRKAGLVRPPDYDPPVEAGQPYEPKLLPRGQFTEVLATPAEPTDRYFLEYPPAALDLFRLGLVGADADRAVAADVNPALLDAYQLNVALHGPTTDAERALYRTFRHAVRVYEFVMLAALVGLMLLVARGVGAGGAASGPMWLLVLPSFLYFTPCRFDILPAALTVCAVAAADRRRTWLSGGCLGLAVALKMYPLALAPLILRYAARNWTDAIIWCAAAAVPLVLSYGAMAWTDGPAGVAVPLRFQLSREPELMWSVVPHFLAGRSLLLGLVRQVPILAAMAVGCWRRPPDAASVLRRAAVTVVVFTACQVFYSPQWWMWVAVLVIPLARTHRWLVRFVVAFDLLTYLHFPVLFDAVAFGPLDRDGWPTRLGHILRMIHVAARVGLWVWLVVGLAWEELKVRRPEAAVRLAARVRGLIRRNDPPTSSPA